MTLLALLEFSLVVRLSCLVITLCVVRETELTELTVAPWESNTRLELVLSYRCRPGPWALLNGAVSVNL